MKEVAGVMSATFSFSEFQFCGERHDLQKYTRQHITNHWLVRALLHEPAAEQLVCGRLMRNPDRHGPATWT